MIKLFKYMKKYTIAILLIFVFLFIQAFCDLALPGYTSDIINIGIQQNGIDETIPKAITKEDMDSVLLFLEKKQQNDFLDCYKKVTPKQASKEQRKDYPAIIDQTLYLVKKGAKVSEKNEKSIQEAFMMVSYMENDSKEMQKVKKKMGLGKDQKMLDVLKKMPSQQVEQITKEMKKEFDKMPDSIISQASVTGIKTFYENAGIDIDQNQKSYLFKEGAKMVGIAFLGMAVAIVVIFISARVAAKFSMELRNRIFNKVLSFSPNEFHKFSTASLITRSTNDVQQIQMLVTMIFRIVLFAPIVGIWGFIKVLKTNSNMEWIIGLAILVIAIIVIAIFILFMPYFKKLQKLIDRMNLVTREILTGLPVIRAFSREKTEEERFNDANKHLTKVNLITSRVMVIMMPMMMLIMNLTTALVVYYGAYRIDDGLLQVGDMMAFIQYAMQIMMSFLMISMISIMIPRAAVSGNRIVEVLETEVTVQDPDKVVKEKEEKKGYVEFKNVTFAYPDGEENVLENINFTAKPSETTAIIGSTGCGKSTLVNLIPRFYDATDGEILVDGVNVKDMTQKELRDKIGYVPQKALLFSGTIASNIRFGNENATDEEVKKAADIAQASEFINTKSNGINSYMAQGGANVSGGQKQRLSIARAIAKKPEILIFDDSFSALDYKTDKVLRETLKKEAADAATIIVAQRISTILKADQIIVLDEGKMVGKGTHFELLRDCEEYRQIAMSQLSEKELEENFKKAGLEGINHE